MGVTRLNILRGKKLTAGFIYNKINAYPNDCMLYWKEKSADTACSTYGTSRWKTVALSGRDYRRNVVQKKWLKILQHFLLT